MATTAPAARLSVSPPTAGSPASIATVFCPTKLIVDAPGMLPRVQFVKVAAPPTDTWAPTLELVAVRSPAIVLARTSQQLVAPRFPPTVQLPTAEHRVAVTLPVTITLSMPPSTDVTTRLPPTVVLALTIVLIRSRNSVA